MKYFVKLNGKKEYVAVPVLQTNKTYKVGRLMPKGEKVLTGYSDHETIESCLVCCKAHNERIGLSDKQVDKWIKKIKDGKGQKSKKGKGNSKNEKPSKTSKKEKRKKEQKRKKSKKGKNNKASNKSKGSKKKGLFRNR
jgi:hypothetical protein